MISTQNSIQVVCDMLGIKSFKFYYLENEKQVKYLAKFNLTRGQIINDLDIYGDVLKCVITCVCTT